MPGAMAGLTPASADLYLPSGSRASSTVMAALASASMHLLSTDRREYLARQAGVATICRSSGRKDGSLRATTSLRCCLRLAQLVSWRKTSS